MIFRIPKGHHWAWPLRVWFWWNRKSFTRFVKFDDTCRYDLQSPDQFDTNKLFGIGYLPWHHKDSARFGWRYWTERKEIEISAYCYVNGQRSITHIGFCEIGKTYQIELNPLGDSYYFRCYEVCNQYLNPNGGAVVTHGHKKKFMYRLGVFFGGNRKAPHEIKIQLSKK